MQVAASRGVPKMARTEEKREDRPSSLLGEGLHDVLAFLCVRLRDDADEYIQDVHAERQRHEDHEPLQNPDLVRLRTLAAYAGKEFCKIVLVGS